MGIAGVREFGLNVIALVGMLRYHEPRSIPQIHARITPKRSVYRTTDGD